MTDGAGRNIGQELEMSMARMDVLKSQMEALRTQRDALVSIVLDYESSLEVLAALKAGSSSETLVPIGATVYLKARITEANSCLLNEGAGVYLERGLEEAVERLKGRKESLEKAVATMGSQLESLAMNYNNLAAHTQDLYGQQMMDSGGPKGNF
jgi:prefoldin alpha subunit